MHALFGLDELWQGDYVMVEISKGIYGLPQAGILSQQRLLAHLNKHGYHEDPNTPCLIKHEWRPLTAVLVVDDFGVKYGAREHVDHFLGVLKMEYELTEDWDGSKYVGLDIEFDRAR